jgi:regulator of replication initiation timing
MAKASASIELEPIERLEKKVKLLVTVLERTRAEQARTLEDNVRLSRELDAVRARLSETENVGAEMTTLRAEREQIRTRVSEMLNQLEALSL